MDRATAEKLLEKVKNDYNQIAEEFSQSRDKLWPEFENFLQYIKPEMRVLDLGCGNGRLYELLKDIGINYTGIDNSARLIQLAQERWEKEPKLLFKVGDVLSLEEPTNNYDSVLLIAVLQHIPSKQLRLRSLQNIKNILKPEGLLIITNWNLWQRKYRKYIFYNWVKKILQVSRLDFNDTLIPWRDTLNRYYHAFTKKETYFLLNKSGFDVVSDHSTQNNIVTVAHKH